MSHPSQNSSEGMLIMMMMMMMKCENVVGWSVNPECPFHIFIQYRGEIVVISQKPLDEPRLSEAVIGNVSLSKSADAFPVIFT